MRTIGAAMLAAAAFAAPALAQDRTADAERGRTLVQRQCAACHQVAQPRNGAGPHLAGVANRPVASVEGFNYSPALKAVEGRWDAATMDRFLADPQAFARGTRQGIAVRNEADRGDIVAFLTAAP